MDMDAGVFQAKKDVCARVSYRLCLCNGAAASEDHGPEIGMVWWELELGAGGGVRSTTWKTVMGVGVGARDWDEGLGRRIETLYLHVYLHVYLHAYLHVWAGAGDASGLVR